MARGRAISGFRDVKMYLTAAGGTGAAAVLAPIDAIKAAVNKVADIEYVYATSGSFTDLAAATILIVGADPNEVHTFTATTTVASAIYLMVYVSSAPLA
tara:strand:+ start:1706 stop:2002 length:297 start_codon:yes stop_codon:yes gene_type:complete